jgi:hypothetical protein
LEEIDGKALPLYARRFIILAGFATYSGCTALIVWTLLLFFSEFSPSIDAFNESVIPFINGLYRLAELLKTVELPSLVTFLALLMYR